MHPIQRLHAFVLDIVTMKAMRKWIVKLSIVSAKIMLFRISIFILCFVCFSCSPEPYKITLAKMVRNQYSKQMLREECLMTVGTGGGMMCEIESFFFALESKKIVHVKEARTIAVKCISNLMKLIDDFEEIQPFLISRPFPTSGVELIISFGISEDPDAVNDIFVKNGKIQYRRYDFCQKSSEKWFSETYEEAIQKICCD
jgi:hypothetical protein